MVRNPIEGYKEFIEDIQKDNRYKDLKNDNKKLWICGLPKSGTTLIEQILDFLPYLRIDRSLLRNFPNKDKLSIKNFSNYTKCFSNDNFSYVKTHLEFDKKLVDHLETYNFLIVVSFRDIRDAMISRYYHILNDKNHWQHELVKNENFETGFINSLKTKYSQNQNNSISEEPLVYYYNWILNWKKIENSKILKVWFEDYKKAPLSYIKKILNFTNFNNYNEKNIYDLIEIKNKKDSSTELNKKLNRINKSVSTFRSGKTGEWKELFTKKINQEFLKIIPDDLSKILK